MLYGAMNFPIKPVVPELEEISRLGFDYLELTMDPPQAHYRIIEDQKAELVAALERLGMGLVCHLPTFVSTADLTESLRNASLREVLNSLQVAAELGAMKACLHPSNIRGIGALVKYRANQYALESLEALVERADRLGVSLCLENMFPQLNSLIEPVDFVEVLGRFPTLKMTLDVAHSHINSLKEEKTLDFINRFHNRIGHLHASDNLGREDDHLPIGTGTVDFPKVVKALKDIGYNGTVTLEVFSKDRDYLKLSRKKLADMFAGL